MGTGTDPPAVWRAKLEEPLLPAVASGSIVERQGKILPQHLPVSMMVLKAGATSGKNVWVKFLIKIKIDKNLHQELLEILPVVRQA